MTTGGATLAQLVLAAPAVVARPRPKLLRRRRQCAWTPRHRKLACANIKATVSRTDARPARLLVDPACARSAPANAGAPPRNAAPRRAVVGARTQGVGGARRADRVGREDQLIRSGGNSRGGSGQGDQQRQRDRGGRCGSREAGPQRARHGQRVWDLGEEREEASTSADDAATVREESCCPTRRGATQHERADRVSADGLVHDGNGGGSR